jgi:uncharacterized protein YbjQ (UPF0145 family)
MKTADIASKNGFNKTDFEQFVRNSGFTYTSGVFAGMNVEDADVDKIVSRYNEKVITQKQAAANEAQRQRQEAERARKAAEEKQRALASMLITSGFSFDGFTIKKYSGYISGDDAVQIARGRDGIFSSPTDVGSHLMASLTVIRRNALAELKEQAYALGCNAVIGVDFDYLTLEPETVNANGGTLYMPYVFGVTANGNAVIIEKNEITLNS